MALSSSWISDKRCASLAVIIFGRVERVSGWLTAPFRSMYGKLRRLIGQFTDRLRDAPFPASKLRSEALPAVAGRAVHARVVGAALHNDSRV